MHVFRNDFLSGTDGVLDFSVAMGMRYQSSMGIYLIAILILDWSDLFCFESAWCLVHVVVCFGTNSSIGTYFFWTNGVLHPE